MTRQARLEPEFAHFYPGVEPDTGTPPPRWRTRCWRCRLLLPSGGFVLDDRAMSGGHFEFRGGAGPRLGAPDRLALVRAPSARSERRWVSAARGGAREEQSHLGHQGVRRERLLDEVELRQEAAGHTSSA